ncbi:TPA: hypothetical protein ACJFE8_001283 [Clostridium sporogenes]
MAIYIGGDTTELSYNFFGKVVGVMEECPMKCYYAANSELLLPTDNRWIELSQERYDKIKNEDNITLDFSTSTLGEKMQTLIELDLKGLCNNIYEGSNSALKGNIKELQISAFAYGSGDSGGKESYLAKTYWFVPNDNRWENWRQQNNTNAIKEIIVTKTEDQGAGFQVDANNKIYMLIVAEYPANSPILNKLSLDYINIKLKTNKQRDSIEPIDIELGEEWSLLFKGVNYNWENTMTDKYLFWLAGTSKENIAFRYINGNIGRLTVQYGSQYLTVPNAPTLRTKQWESNNYLIQYKDNIYTCYHLDSKELRKFNFSDNIGFKKGLYKLFYLQHNGNGYQADAFIDDVQVLSEAFTDQEAEIILKGRNEIDKNNKYYNQLAETYENVNLIPDFKHSNWSIHPNAIISSDGSTLTLVATSNYQGSSIILPVLPNNRYKIKVEIEDTNNSAHIAVQQRCNSTTISSTRVYDNSSSYNGEFATQDKVNKIVVVCQNTSTGSFKFKNLELRRLY